MHAFVECDTAELMAALCNFRCTTKEEMCQALMNKNEDLPISGEDEGRCCGVPIMHVRLGLFPLPDNMPVVTGHHDGLTAIDRPPKPSGICSTLLQLNLLSTCMTLLNISPDSLPRLRSGKVWRFWNVLCDCMPTMRGLKHVGG